jgi:hypothetical protein
LPAPVSPVSTVSPAPKLTSTDSITAMFDNLTLVSMSTCTSVQEH